MESSLGGYMSENSLKITSIERGDICPEAKLGNHVHFAGENHNKKIKIKKLTGTLLAQITQPAACYLPQLGRISYEKLCKEGCL